MLRTGFRPRVWTLALSDASRGTRAAYVPSAPRIKGRLPGVRAQPARNAAHRASLRTSSEARKKSQSPGTGLMEVAELIGGFWNAVPPSPGVHGVTFTHISRTARNSGEHWQPDRWRAPTRCSRDSGTSFARPHVAIEMWVKLTVHGPGGRGDCVTRSRQRHENRLSIPQPPSTPCTLNCKLGFGYTSPNRRFLLSSARRSDSK